MTAQRFPSIGFKPNLSSILLLILLVGLWVAGGASRANAAGQVIVQIVAVGSLVIAILFGARPAVARHRPVWVILMAAIILALLQLVPLPPAIWSTLPGRAVLSDAATLAGEQRQWRPLSLVPGATVSAVMSLTVPIATLYLLAGMGKEDWPRLLGLLLCVIVGGALLGLFQFSGMGLNNPLINNMPGEVSGMFANRNHFALLLALGCLIAPAWAFQNGRPGWRAPLALCIVLVFVLTILASGSRAGILLGMLGIGIGLLLTRGEIRRELINAPRWAFPTIVGGIVVVIAVFVLLSVAADRAVSVERAFALDQGQDMRVRGLPAVLAMIGTYFPAGSGLGGFDQIFRMQESFDLLKPTYFNHAHNDFLEIALDAGLPGILLALAALGWWCWSSIRAWRWASGYMLPKLGSAILLLIIVASLFDYPARTPIIMAMTVIAAVWMSDDRAVGGRPPLPRRDQHL